MKKNIKNNVAEYQNSLEKIKNIKSSIDEIFDLVDNETSRKYKEMSKSMGFASDKTDEKGVPIPIDSIHTTGITHDNIMTYLGMVEQMINEMIKQYAYYLAQNLKTAKKLDQNDPTIVTLNNILMVAPKTDPIKYDVHVTKFDEENIEMEEDMDSKPWTFDDFQKYFDKKNAPS